MAARKGRVVLTAVAALLYGATSARANSIDLASVLSNSGYESGLVHLQWTDTRPNSSYLTSVPVNPLILPLDPSLSNGTTLAALTAPAGNNFIGVPNPTLN